MFWTTKSLPNLKGKDKEELIKLQEKFNKLYKARVQTLNRECAQYLTINKAIQSALFELENPS